MCGYILTSPLEALRRLFGALSESFNLGPHYNIAPTPLTLPRLIEMFQVMAELEGLCGAVRDAFLFQACSLTYRYEREGFDLTPREYLPDFWLPSVGIWFEVKGWSLPRWKKTCANTSRMKQSGAW